MLICILEDELRRLLALDGMPVAVEPGAGTMLGGREAAWREFLRQRNDGPAKAGDGFRIEFPEVGAWMGAVEAEIHFGMGDVRQRI